MEEQATYYISMIIIMKNYSFKINLVLHTGVGAEYRLQFPSFRILLSVERRLLMPYKKPETIMF